MKTHIFHQIKYFLRAHLRSHKVTLLYEYPIFLCDIFGLKSKLFLDANIIKTQLTSKVMDGTIWPAF